MWCLLWMLRSVSSPSVWSHGEHQPPKDLLNLHLPCVITVLPWNEFTEEKYTTTETNWSYSCLVSNAIFSLHNHFICQAPFLRRNHCWSLEVWWVHWQYLPGDLYLLVGKGLFRVLSNEKRAIHLTPTKKTPATLNCSQARCRQRTLLARSMLRTQTSTWTPLGTWLLFKTRCKHGFATLLWCILLLSTFFKAQIYSCKYLQKLEKK